MNIALGQSTYTPPNWFRTTRSAPLTDLTTVQDILISNYATINDGQDDLPGILQALELAKRSASPSSPVKVVFEKGTYDLFPDGSQTHAIFFNSANSVVIEGNKANIQIHNPEVGFFSMFQSKNVIIKDLIIDYETLPFTQGTVTARNFSNNSFTLNIDAGFPLLNEAHFGNASEKWGMLKEADGRLKSGVSNLISVQRSEQISGNQFQVFLNGNILSQFEINDRYVQIARNNGRTIFRSNSGENITYIGITSYASPAGSYNVFNHKEWSLINCKVLIKSGRIHSGNADILHINGGYIGPWVEGCRFEGQSDDAINMKNTKMDILSILSPTEITGSLALTTQDTISFYNPRDGVFLGRVGLTKAAEFVSSGKFKLTLSEPVNLTNLSDANVGDKAYIETRMNESFVFINDTIRNGRRYGMLLQNGYGVVENCVFENLSNSAIRMENGVDWGEGFVAIKIQIANNRFINNGLEKEFNDDPLASTITAMISKLGNGNCNPWCGTEITEWNGLEDIWIENNYFEYNKASINIHNYALKDVDDLSLVLGFTDKDISLAGAFDDILGANWSLNASSNNTSVATVSVSNKTLTITEGANSGSALINIAATNTSGGKAYSSLKVQVAESVLIGDTDQYWSNASNWQSGQKPSSLAAVLVLATQSYVDESFTLSQISNDKNAANINITGDKAITLQNTSGSADPAILNQSDRVARFSINTPLIIDNITNAFTYLGLGGSVSNILEFGTESSLQVNTRTMTYSVNNERDRIFEFNGSLVGNNNLIFGNFTNNVFGATASNRLFTGDLVFFADSEVRVEMHEDSIFLPQSRKIQVNGKNAYLVLNKPNLVRGNISVAGANDITLEINENQTAFNQIVMAEDGIVKLVVDKDVDSVFFKDNSASGWGTGKVIIEGFRNGVIRFGTNQNGITSTQLNQIEINGVTAFQIDERGFLYGTQTTIFNGNSALDNLWSNTGNWLNGLRGDAAEYAQFNASAELDVLATVNQIRSGGDGAILDQGGTLNVTGKGYTAAILQIGGDGATFNIDAQVIINSTDDFENLQVNGTNGTLTFGSNSDLMLRSNARLNANATLNRRINMNGKLKGEADLEIAGNSNVVFGATSDHSNFQGNINYVGTSATIQVNSTDNSVFTGLENALNVKANSGNLYLNGANVFRGDLVLEDGNNFSLFVNKNQPNISSISLGTGTLTLTIGSEVGSIWFGDNSSSIWNTGTISVANFQNETLRFGVNSYGLTESQLSQINVGTAYLNASGYLKTANSVWNGTGWSATPIPSSNVVIEGNYSEGSLEVNDLTIRSGATVDIGVGETFKINGDLINHGKLRIASGGSLVTLGNVVGEASISRTTTFADHVGKYSVIGSPVQEASTSELGSLIYAYREDIAYGLERFSKITAPQIMAVGDAYFSAFTGAVTFTGVPNTGNIDVSLVYDASKDGGASNAGFNLVSNPYPCAISYSSLINATTNPDINASIYLWDDGGSDQGRGDNSDYIVINSAGVAGSGSGRANDWNGYIGSAQGFFVKANKVGTVHFTNEMKASGNNADLNFFRKESSATDKLKVVLASQNSNQNHSAIISFAEDASEGMDRSYDAVRMNGGDGFGVYSFIEDQPMTIQGLPLLTKELTVPLGVTVNDEGTYTFSIEEFTSFQHVKVSLIDKLLSKETVLAEGVKYTFSSEAANAPEDRFHLVFTPSRILKITHFDGLEVVTAQNMIEITSLLGEQMNGELTIFDIQGRVVLHHTFQVVNSKMSLPFIYDSKQIYILQLNVNDVVSSRKFIFN
ncbi:MAG: hypothetical protein RIC03_12400 [Cyclobacteriaceae bacterium]